LTYIHTPVARLFLALLLWLAPAVVFAAAPANITGITATEQSGQIFVTWTAPTNANTLTSYRVYVSRQSILQNNGAYDDVEVTSANSTDYTFTKLPTGNQFYVSVIAANAEGEESTFSEEAFVVLSSLPMVSSGIFVGPVGTTPTQLQLLSAASVSATGVLLTFNAPIVVPREKATEAFRISDASGAQLTLTRLVIDGPTVTIHTFPQTKDHRYRVSIFPVIQGKDSTGAQTLMLDTLTSTGDFTTLASLIGTWKPPKPTKPTKPSHSGDLSETGMGMVAIMMVAGATAGYVRERQKNAKC